MLFVSCGGGDRSANGEAAAQNDAPPPARVVACDMLTREEVAQVVGEPVTRTEPREIDAGDDSPDPPYSSMCTYIAERGAALLTTTLSVRRSPEVRDPASALNDYVESVRSGLSPDFKLEPVTEYGPGAGWDPKLAMLSVFRPNWMLSVTMDSNAGATALEGAKALMAKVLERLP
jgi:hypothetical protein